MFVEFASPQAVEPIRVAVVLLSVISVVFWRALIKIVLILVAIALLVLLMSGAISILQGFQHVHS